MVSKTLRLNTARADAPVNAELSESMFHEMNVKIIPPYGRKSADITCALKTTIIITHLQHMRNTHLYRLLVF